MELKDRFKKYLEEQFRSIKPTEAAKDFRIRTFKELMDKVQDLRIKGTEDEEVIYNMCIESLGNFPPASRILRKRSTRSTTPSVRFRLRLPVPSRLRSHLS